MRLENRLVPESLNSAGADLALLSTVFQFQPLFVDDAKSPAADTSSVRPQQPFLNYSLHKLLCKETNGDSFYHWHYAWKSLGYNGDFSSKRFVSVMIAPQTFGVMLVNPAFLSQVEKQGQADLWLDAFGPRLEVRHP